ncbi:hypothetical protein CHUAL_010281 [Chamberlinius hualienensis]
MPSIFRSESMSLWQLFLQPENAYSSVARLGEMGIAHFRDLNPDLTVHQRKFTNDVRRCDELERKLAFIEKNLNKHEIKVAEIDVDTPAPAPRDIFDLEASLDKTEAELREVNINTDALEKNFVELNELKHVLEKTRFFFDEQEQMAIEEHLELPTHDTHQHSINFSFIAGVILSERIRFFEQMLWRMSQGNTFLRVVPIEQAMYDVASGDEVFRSVFIIFFQGEQLKQRVKKLCEGFRTSMYPVPDTVPERAEMLAGVKTRIADLNTVLNQSKDHRHRLLLEAAKNYPSQLAKACKMKAIYHILNQFNFDITQKALIGECWVADVDANRYTSALHKTYIKTGSSVPPITNKLQTYMHPPTYYRTNKFTGSFQGIVDSYGVASYEEVNPAFYSIITFPFLFAVMFGDTGHGVIMSIFAAWMVLWEKPLLKKKTDNEIWNIIFGGRYIILLMGLFSIYTGFIYNDIFSKAMNIFGSQWGSEYDNSTLESNEIIQLNPDSEGKNFYGYPYPFGIDPIWQLSTNSLTFLDSYKMKLSVILGVVHMMFGVCLSCFNFIHFGEYSSVLVELLPQVIFLSAIFGYLDVLIIWKWFKFTPDDSGIAPNLLITLIDMFLGKEYDLKMYDNQDTIQKILVIVAIVCIPWMFVIRPFIRKSHYKHAVKRGSEKYEFGDLLGPNGEFQMGEIFVHQTIHTIEYCLGCISNTASYLRLWALSLAHNQLSDVLWKLVMRLGLIISDNVYAGGVILFGLFGFWAVLTISILLIMEGLSAFLHALRLHWVEFMNKFYKGEGYLFAPFSFRKILLHEDEE